jgi:hypothetical protein
VKTIWGLFVTYQDAGGALDEFQRRAYAPEDLSGVLQPSAPPSGATLARATGGHEGNPEGQGRREGRVSPRQRGQGGAAGPGNIGPGSQPAADAQPLAARANPQPPHLPGGRTIRLGGTPPLIASGRLATAISRERPLHRRPASEQEPRSQPVDQAEPALTGLARVLNGMGLPETFAQNYADGVSRGQVLLAVRIPDERERDTVMLMRRYRVVQLAGQHVDDE